MGNTSTKYAMKPVEASNDTPEQFDDKKVAKLYGNRCRLKRQKRRLHAQLSGKIPSYLVKLRFSKS